MLEQKKLIYAAFEEGGKVISSKINMAGCAVLDDLKELEKVILNHALYARNIRKCDYEILLDLKIMVLMLFPKKLRMIPAFLKEFLFCAEINGNL